MRTSVLLRFLSRDLAFLARPLATLGRIVHFSRRHLRTCREIRPGTVTRTETYQLGVLGGQLEDAIISKGARA